MTTIYLVEMVVYDPAIPGTKTLRYCTGTGYTTSPSETPANTYYEPRVKQPALMQRDVFENGTTYGASRVAYGELVLTNPDGALDDLINFGFDGRTLTVLMGDQDASYPSGFTTVLTGTMEQPQFDWKDISVRIRDRQAELDIPIQATKYAGGGETTAPAGLEGYTDSIKGQPKPLTYGTVFNVSPPIVNPSRLIFQVNDGAVYDVTAVYDRGASLTKGADYTSQADMEANTPSASNFRVWKAGGMFRLGSSPAGQITADVTQGATTADRTVAQIVQTIVTTHGDIDSADVVSADITALDTANSAEVGIWIGDETNINRVLDELCASVGAWWGFDRLGQFRIQQLAEPTGTPVATFTEVEITSIQRLASSDTDKGIPAHRAHLNYARNWTPQDSDLAGSVTTERRGFLKEEYRRITVTDTAVQTKHLLAPEITFQTLLTDASAANTEASRRLAIYKERHDRLAVRVRIDADLAALIDLGAVVEIQLDRFGYDAGKLFRVIGLKTDYRVSAVEMTLWG